MKWFVRDLGCNSKDVQILLTYDRFTVEQYAWPIKRFKLTLLLCNNKKIFQAPVLMMAPRKEKAMEAPR
jgi:hypothetical protein